MIRMALAAFAVYLLIPEDVSIVSSGQVASEKVTAGQTLEAANAIISDIAEFCDRNKSTCDTGKTLLSNAKSAVHSGIQQAQDRRGSETTTKAPSSIEPISNSD